MEKQAENLRNYRKGVVDRVNELMKENQALRNDSLKYKALHSHYIQRCNAMNNAITHLSVYVIDIEL
jgi:hypothetical protein